MKEYVKNRLNIDLRQKGNYNRTRGNIMLNVAIVEDDKREADRLAEFLRRYAQDNGIRFNVKLFDSGIKFLDTYQAKYDIVFMDIDLPVLNGLETSRGLRKIDSTVALVFVTNLAQFAINGYEFDASDYMLKPLKYQSFSLKIKKVIDRCRRHRENEIKIKTPNGEVRFSSAAVIYVEVNLHNVTYHTEQGDYTAYGTMKQAAAQFPPEEFVLCNSCYLVNLRHVTMIEGYMIRLGEHELVISHPKRKKFIEALHAYYGTSDKEDT